MVGGFAEVRQDNIPGRIRAWYVDECRREYFCGFPLMVHNRLASAESPVGVGIDGIDLKCFKSTATFRRFVQRISYVQPILLVFKVGRWVRRQVLAR